MGSIVLEELRLVRADIGDFRADMEVQSAIIRRLDQSEQSQTGEVRALAAQHRTASGNGWSGCRVG